MNSLFARRFFQMGNVYCKKCIKIRLCSNLALNMMRQPIVSKSAHELYLFDFEQNENEFYYRYLVSKKKYRHLLAFLDYANDIPSSIDADSILNSDWSKKHFYMLVDDLKFLTHTFKNIPEKFDDPKFLNFCRNLLDRLPDALDDHLLNILKILTLWPKTCRIKDGLFFMLCKAIDGELLKRGKTWGRDKLLLTMDHFYRLRLVRYSQFFWENMKRAGRTPYNLTPEQFIHSMFLMSAHRRKHPVIDSLIIEQAIKHHIYELSMEETAISLLAFFKTKQQLSDTELIELLYTKLDINLDSVDEITLAAFLKILRISTSYSMRHRMATLLHNLESRIDQISLMSCIRVALLGSNHVLLFHPETLNKVYRRFVKEISSARLKDIERLLFISALYDYDADTEIDFCDFAAQEISKRMEEIRTHPRVFLSAVSYLCQKGRYNFDLLNTALSESFLTSVFQNISKYTIPASVLQMANGVRLECPNYTGNNLDLKKINEIAEGGICYKIPSPTQTFVQKADRVMLQVKNILEQRFGGEDFVYYIYLLPYSSRPEIVFCIKDGKAVKIPSEMKSKRFCLNLAPSSSMGTWYALLLLTNRNSIADSRKPAGNVLVSMRHLTILGYKCLLLHEIDWDDLNKDKQKLLSDLIENSKSNS